MLLEVNALKNVISDLEPKGVMKYFEQLSAVPRGSGRTQAATQFCVDFAKAHSLEYYTDKTGNVVIYKKASSGCENSEPVIIQGHLDMVCEKAPGVDFDFETEGLKLAVDGDFINASGTTLGGDDGIAVAMALAVLESDSIKHPPIEAVFTVDEETGMTGATEIDTSVLKGRRMLNIDSEEEGTLLVSCAGGVRADVMFKANTIPAQGTAYSVRISGLHGGHSGTDINKGYLSANKLMGEALSALFEKNNIRLCCINGGTVDNAITRECIAVVKTRDTDAFEYETEKIIKEFSRKYSSAEPGLLLTYLPCDLPDESFDTDSTKSVIRLLNELPQGVVSMSKNIEGMVETSLNMGVVKTEEHAVTFVMALRSGIDSEKEELLESVKRTAAAHGASVRTHSDYPAWEFVENSPLQKVMTDVYYRQTGKEMNVTAIHAGLECGIFCGKIKGLDCVSFGPDIFDIHTPDERLSISSVQRVWNYLLAVLEELSGKPSPAAKAKKKKRTERKAHTAQNNKTGAKFTSFEKTGIILFFTGLLLMTFLILISKGTIKKPVSRYHYKNAVAFIEIGNYEAAYKELDCYTTEELEIIDDAYALYKICLSHREYEKGDLEEALDDYKSGDRLLRFQSPEALSEIKEYGSKVEEEYKSSSRREYSERQSRLEKDREWESSKKARESSEAAERSEREKTTETTKERYTAPLVIYDTTRKRYYYEETTTTKKYNSYDYDYDDFDVDGFSDAEDFYDWYYDDFYDFEEAEEYFNDYY